MSLLVAAGCVPSSDLDADFWWFFEYLIICLLVMAADMFLHQQQYGLSYQVNDSRNKTFIFVKLTDSALKSIEDYLSKKVGS